MQLAWFFHMKFQGGERISGCFHVELDLPSQGWSPWRFLEEKKKESEILHETKQ